MNKAWKNVNNIEMEAFIGIYIMMGVDRHCDTPVRELFCDEFSSPWYRATFGENRFNVLKKFLRFDDKNTRDQRLESDRLASIRHVWNMFLNNCKRKYTIGPNATVDEQLLGYRGRCKFIHYIPTKPDKYGIKVFWLCDAENSYALNEIVDIGKEPNQPRRKNYGRDVVLQLATPIYGTGRNITFDNFFTSLDLAERLLLKRLTSVWNCQKKS